MASGRLGSILVYEHVSGGGMAGEPLPPSWAAEGGAIRRAIVAEFAALEGFEVVEALDPRSEPTADLGPNAGRVRSVEAPSGRPIRLPTILPEADLVVVVAPESLGLLERLAREVEWFDGPRSVGSSPGAIALAADKARFARHLIGLGLPTPPTVEVEAGAPLPDLGPEMVVKPLDGAGAVDTFLLRGASKGWPASIRSGRFVAQPLVEGSAFGASYLVDRAGRATRLAVGRQRVEVDASGAFRYRGGSIPADPGVDLSAVDRAAGSVPGLLGLVGVDFVAEPGGSASIIELNPRPTTSVVALARLGPPGALAGAWLDACAGRPFAFAFVPSPPLTIHFDADGSARTRA